MITSTRELVNLFLDVSKIEGLSGKERATADFIRSFLTKLGLSPIEDNSYLKSNGNTGNIICTFGTNGDRVLLAHMDTALSTKGIRHVCTNGKISSDGSTILGADNRAGVSILLKLAERIVAESIPHRDFSIAFTVEEETSLNGSKQIQLHSGTKMGFVFDSAYRPGTFVNGSCGAVTFTITIQGKAAHAGLHPEKGKSTIHTAGELITKIPTGKIDENTTCNIGIISGGDAVNVVPDHTTLKGEIRSYDLKNINVLLDRLTDICTKVGRKHETPVRLDYRWDFMPYTVKEDEQVYLEITRAIREENLTPSAIKTCGGSDANSLNEKGIKSVNIGIGAQNPHSTDEFILVEDLEKSANIALNLVKK